MSQSLISGRKGEAQVSARTFLEFLYQGHRGTLQAEIRQYAERFGRCPFIIDRLPDESEQTG